MTTDPDEFRDRWHSYIDDFDRLRLALDEEQTERLDDLQTDLHDLVDEAAAIMKHIEG